MIELVKDGITMRVQTEGQVAAFLNNGYKRVSEQEIKEAVQPNPEKVEDASEKQDEKAESEKSVAEQASKSGKSAK